MSTIQVSLDDRVIDEVDEVIKSLGITRSAFVQAALNQALRGYKLRQMEEKHIEGYNRHPVEDGEFDTWESEQVWGDE